MTHRARFVLCLGALGLLAPGWSRPARAGSASRGEHCPYKIETTHFDVEFSVPPRIGKGYASLCEKAYGKFCKIFDVDETAVVWEGKCHVYLFKDRDAFVEFATSVHGSQTGASSGGYTRITKQDPDIVLFLHGDDHTKLQQTLIHEMTHVFLQLFHKEAQIPLWIHEGFAQYFEFLHRTDDSRQKLARRVSKSMVKRGNAAPLSQFWLSTFPPVDLASYSQAWSLIDFIAGSSDLRRKTGKFILKIKDASLGPVKITSTEDLQKAMAQQQEEFLKIQEQALQEIFGMSLREFEARWKRYVLARY